MFKQHWFFRPVSIFILSLIALAASFFLYIYWYLRVHTGLEVFVEKFKINPDPFMEARTWVIILVLSILLAIIIVGLIIIFTYYHKSINLYRLQNNFINNFTHELKTPLTSLKLFLDTFKNHELKRSDQLKYLNYMEKDTVRLSTIVDRILSIARIESNTYKTKFERVDLRNTTKIFIDNHDTVFRKVEIKCEEPKSESPFFYQIDKGLFEMLLSNIITNAIKYNESEKPQIKINFYETPKSFDIAVIDNGIGIEKKELKHIFRKFYQIGTAMDMTAKGSGIGLFLVQTIAQIHKAKVVVESAGLANGSTFTIKFPSKWRES